MYNPQLTIHSYIFTAETKSKQKATKKQQKTKGKKVKLHVYVCMCACDYGTTLLPGHNKCARSGSGEKDQQHDHANPVVEPTVTMRYCCCY